MRRTLSLLAALSLIASGCCQKNSCLLEPSISFIPQKSAIDRLPSAFEPLTSEELQQDWGRELLIGENFAREFDLYRAITAFRRAEILIPNALEQRKKQIQYNIILSYYLGNKYRDVIDTFESSLLMTVGPSFPAFDNLLMTLYDSYQKEGVCDKANIILQLIEKHSSETAEDLALGTLITQGNLVEMQCFPTGQLLVSEYAAQTLSVRKAQTLNALLPGAGYYYVGQSKAALTSFIINALFIAAAYQLYHRGYIAGGIIVTSLEMGWYFGGINGAGLAAKEYNEQLYNTLGKETMICKRLFPILTFEHTF